MWKQTHLSYTATCTLNSCLIQLETLSRGGNWTVSTMIGNSVYVKDQWMINVHTIRTFGTTTKSQTNDPDFIHQSYYHVKTGTNENYVIKQISLNQKL
jgi:hypothetical protein